MTPIDEVSRLIVHHSASSLDTGVDDIERWHVDENGWDAIGYHWIISSLGIIYPTRPLNYRGAHVRGANADSWGVCLVGDNTKETQRWTVQQVGALQRLWLSCRVLVPKLDIGGHRDYADGTECPGIDVRPLILGPRA